MTNVVLLAHEKNDNRMMTVEQMLECALEDVRSGKLKADKMLLLNVDQDVGFYDIGFYACNMSASEMLLACARAEYQFNKTMDGE